MEVAMDERVSGEEGLRLAQRLEPLHLAFSAPCRSMWVLGAVVIRHNSGDATSSLWNLGLLAVSSGDRDRGVGSTFGGQAGVSDELRARVVIWPPPATNLVALW